MIVAFINDSEYRTFRNPADVPQGATSFSSAEELGRALSVQSLDRMRSALVGRQLPPSDSRTNAANKLWYLLTVAEPPIDLYTPREKTTTALGTVKCLTTAKVELIEMVWFPNCPGMADFYVRKMGGMKRQIFDMLVDDGRGIWTEQDVVKIVVDRGSELRTKQTPFMVWNIYRSEYFNKGILRRLSYLDLSKRLSNVSVK